MKNRENHTCTAHRRKLVTVICLALTMLVPQSRAAITFTPLQTTFNNPIGIDYIPVIGAQPAKMIVSANYNAPTPNTLPDFEIINEEGVHAPFSTRVGNHQNEMKIATAKISPGPTFFPLGTVAAGSGSAAGQLVRLNADSSGLVTITLPGESGIVKGVYFDRTGIWDYDLIAVTSAGGIWKIRPNNAVSLVTRIQNVELEAVMTVPQSGAWGPWSGAIIAGAEEQHLIYAVKRDLQITSYALGINPEDFDLIEAGQHFYGTDFGGSRILKADASHFDAWIGQILVAQAGEHGDGGQLFRVWYNGTSMQAEGILTPAQATAARWEHVTFAPVDPKPTVTITAGNDAAEPSTDGSFTVSRTGDITYELPVFYSYGNSQAIYNSDYRLLPNPGASFPWRITIPGGSSSVTLTVDVIDDTQYWEGEESVVIDILDDPTYRLGSPSSDSIVIGDNDIPPPTVHEYCITPLANAAEPNTAGSFRISRNFTRTHPESVMFSLSGTATHNTDYTLRKPDNTVLTSPFDFPANATTMDVTVAPIDDSIADTGETVTMRLHALLPLYRICQPDSATVKVVDDEVRLEAVSLTPSQFSFRIFGDSGVFCTIEASDDLFKWVVDGAVTLPPATFTYQDSAVGLGQRYYRVRTPTSRSTNAVGFVRVNVPTGVEIISNPFRRGNNHLNTILPLPANADGTTIHRFDPSTQSYGDSIQWVTDYGWFTAEEQRPNWLNLPPGEGVFIEPLVNGASGPLNIHFIGEVPQGSLSRPLLGEFKMSLVGSLVPDAWYLGTPTENFPAVDGDTLFIFNPSTQQYNDSYSYFEGYGWFSPSDPTPEGPVIGPAQGFWVQKYGANTTWTRTFSVWDPPAPLVWLGWTAPNGGGMIDIIWWDPSEAAQSFEIWRSLDGAPFSLFAIVQGQGWDFYNQYEADTFPGHTYAYRVKAFGAVGASPFSNTATVTTPPQ